MAREGIQRLVLTSRRGPGAPGAAELEAELVALGPSVELVACDVADPEALGALLDRLRREGPPLRAVFHSAGLVDDELIARLDPEQLRGPSLPKVGPAWQLHAATRDLELDAFVLYSSAAGTLAQIGQANYAAANAYLDALCQLRREAGLPGLSMAWGLWAGPSMATSVRAQLESQGVSAMEPAPAIAGLRRAVALGDAHVVLGAFDWAKVRFGGRGQLLAILQSEGVEAEEAAADSSFDLDALPRGERGPAIQAFVLDAVARTLRLSPEEADPKRSLTALGLDSMTSVELRDELRERGAFEVRLADLLRGVSVAELSEQLLAAYEGELDGDEVSEAPASPWLWCPAP
ncbi:type I polyketide synthase, partial [Plesiocystis pacifica SIR-1]